MTLRDNWLHHCSQKFIHPEKLSATVTSLKQQGHTIVTINGSFDLLHAGHLFILYEASLQADILIVGVNSDCSVQSYKALNRPIIPLSYRMELLAALEMVDYVSWFDETTPCAWLEKIHPHIHVNGAEYGADCIESTLLKKQGARLHLVPRAPSLSTSDIIKKIHSLSL